MIDPANVVAYRARRFHRKDSLPKKYQYSLELSDDRTQEVMAACDLLGRATFTTLTIVDHQHLTWQVKPNRKIMPSRWIVTDPMQQVVMQFDQKILEKVVNPLYRAVLVMLDAEEKEIFRLVDPRTSLPDRLLDPAPDEHVIMAGDRVVAKLVSLPSQENQPTGFWGKLKAFLTISDRGIVSAGSNHVLPAPVALGMLMIADDLIKTSRD